MAEHKDSEESNGEPAANAGSVPEQATAKSELPAVESPSISPAPPEPVIEPVAPVTPAIEPIAAAPEIAIDSDAPEAHAKTPRFIMKARHRRDAVLAASVVFAGAIGAIIGSLASSFTVAPPPRTDIAAVEERKAMEKSIAHLSREVASLKANLETTNKAAHSQIAKITARLAAKPEITGTIPAPQSPTPAAAPIPTPRPAPHIAAVESRPPARPAVVSDWTIRAAREGAVYVERHGEIYQVVVGAPLPGLGPVEAIKRQDGRWVVVTPKGIIVALRDRRYFEQF